MRRLLFILTLALLGGNLSAQNSVGDFYQKFKKQENVTNFKLPGWLVWIGTGLVYNSIRNEETRTWLRLSRKMGKIRLLQCENSNSITQEDVSALVSSLKSGNAGYDDLVYVRNEDSNFNVMIREGAKGRLKELLLVGSDDGETVLFSAKTRLKMKDINEVLDYYLKELGWKEKAKAKKLPQA